jgi:hypothetical protein
MDDHLEYALRASVKKQAAFQEAQGKSFNEFARKQVETVQDPLFQLDGTLKQGQDAIKAADSVIVKMRSELGKLRPLNDDIKAKRKDTQATPDRHAKNCRAVERAQQKMELLRTKAPDSPQFMQAQAEFENCTRQRDVDAATLEERGRTAVQEERQYKKQLWDVVLKALELYADAKKAAAGSLTTLGGQMRMQADAIAEFDDPQIETLLGQLQVLQSEIDPTQ